MRVNVLERCANLRHLCVKNVKVRVSARKRCVVLGQLGVKNVKVRVRIGFDLVKDAEKRELFLEMGGIGISECLVDHNFGVKVSNTCDLCTLGDLM